MNVCKSLSLNGTRSHNKQKGLVTIFVTMAFLLFIGIAALTIDVNHAYMNKSKLQNSVDAAALAGAYYAANDKSETEINAIIINTIEQAESFAGNSELNDISSHVTIHYDSSSDGNFTSSTMPSSEDIYIRVTINYSINNIFPKVFDMDNYELSVSAVAGPSSDITGTCNIVPLAVCAAGPNSGTTIAGYVPGDVYAIKGNVDDLGSNNYNLVDLGAGADANTIKEAMASGYEQCVDIAPGTMLGIVSGVKDAVAKGMNTRLGIHDGEFKSESDYPSDTCISQPVNPACFTDSVDLSQCANKKQDATDNIYFDASNNFDYSDYESCPDKSTSEWAVSGRRILHVPIVDCSGLDDKSTEAPIQTFGCFFLLQEVGLNGTDQTMFGQFMKECPIVNGTFEDLNSNKGPFRVVLYKDPLSEDS